MENQDVGLKEVLVKEISDGRGRQRNVGLYSLAEL